MKKKKFMEKLWPTYVHQTTLLDAKEVDSKKSLTYVFCPQVNGRLFSKVEQEKQIEMEADKEFCIVRHTFNNRGMSLPWREPVQQENK